MPPRHGPHEVLASVLRSRLVASYVLAPGFFADVVVQCGADVVTAPLAPDERLAAILVERYRDAVGQPAQGVSSGSGTAAS